MKKAFLSLLIIFLLCCSIYPQKVERTKENGVKVIINHIEPYKIEGEPSKLILDEEFRIDLEKEDIVKIGLFDCANSSVDTEGNIYLLNRKPKKHCIFKFDKNGSFLTSFGKYGQGPGELSRPFFMVVNNDDEILVQNPLESKISVFTKDGIWKKEVSAIKNVLLMYNLENGNYFIYYMTYNLDPNSSTQGYLKCSIINSEFKEIKELDRYEMQRNSDKEKMDVISNVTIPCVGNGYIYLGKRDKDYEIWVYDLDGNLKRKIKKAYQPVKVTEEYKIKFLEERVTVPSEEYKKKLYFPKYFPAFQFLFSDDRGRLYVTTYEEGKKAGEYVNDIFSSKGILIMRKSLSLADYKIINDRMHCLREKESGYKELVVYKMIWQ